jgi:hypothetical protein
MPKNKWPFYLVLVTASLMLLAPLYLFGEGEKTEIGSLTELINRYDSARCKECHAEIYAQWEKSHHARPLMGMDDWIFMSKYLKEGPLSVTSPKQATKANFPCAKCHLPQLFKTTDAVAAELAAAVFRDEKKLVKQLNIGCLVCHQDKAVVHGRPEKSTLYGNQEIKNHEALPVKKSLLLKNPLFCGQCHGLGPNLEFENPIQCATLYGSYLHAYIPNGGTKSCQDCHMPNRDHTCLPNFNDRQGTSERLKQALPLEVETLGYVFQIEEGKPLPLAVVKTRITNKAGHRIPDG